jgi:hypothetical protein
MTDRELMQMAFKAMDSVNDFSSNSIYAGIFDWEVKILRDRLAQPEQPDFSKAGFGKPQREEGCAGCGKKASKGWALYCVKCTEREWVGLTDEQVDGYWDESVSTGCRLSFGMGVDYANRVLKEKNT